MCLCVYARSINAGRRPQADLLSNLGPARFARTAQRSDTKGCRVMQYCPSDSTAEERGGAERDTTKPRRGAGARITRTRVARSVADLRLSETYGYPNKVLCNNTLLQSVKMICNGCQ